MAKEAKDGMKATYFLDKKLVAELSEFCERTGRTKTKVVEIALKEYLLKHRRDKA